MCQTKQAEATVGSGPVAPGFWGTPDGKMLGRILGIGALGIGGGAAARALFGAKDLVGEQLGRRKVPRRPAVIEANVPELQDAEEEEAQRRPLGLGKIAEGNEPIRLTDYVWPPNWFRSAPADPNAPSFFSRAAHGSDMATPTFLPGAIAAGGAGLYAGYKGLGGILNWMHKRDRKNEVEDAKEEYRKALIEQYNADSPAIKRAASESLYKDLNTLYGLYKNEITKAASWNDVLGTGTGAYLTLAGLLAGGTGLATYNWAKTPSSEERLAKAIKQRERLRWATRPPEIYAISKPRPAAIGQPPEEEEEENASAIRKVAALYR